MAKHYLVDEGEGRWFDYGTDHGRPVRLKVHALTDAEERTANHAAFGTRKTDKLRNETWVRNMDRLIILTRERAKLALDDTENYSVEISGPKAAEMFSKFLAQEVKAGTEVCLDGHWTDEVRAFMLPRVKELAKEIVEMSGKVVRAKVEEEGIDTEDFSQP